MGSEFRVTGGADGNDKESTVAALPGGRFVVVWTDALFGERAMAQIYSQTGQKIGPAIVVSEEVEGARNQVRDPVVAVLSNGSFVVAWTSFPESTESDVKAQIIGASGERIGGNFLLNANSEGQQVEPQIAALEKGGFVATWTDYSSSADPVRVFDNDGTGVDSVFEANMYAQQVTALAGGGYVLTWAENFGGTRQYDIVAQMFDAGGNRVGNSLNVNTSRDDTQTSPKVSELAGGGFVVAWRTFDNSGQPNGVYAQVFDAEGRKVGAEVLIEVSRLYPREFDVTGLASGGFIVQTTGSDADGLGIYRSVFDASGKLSGDPVRVNAITAADQVEGGVATMANGDQIHVWDTYSPSADFSYERLVKARILELSEGPQGSALGDAIDLSTLRGGRSSGGAGDDTYTVDDPLDMPVEAWNRGIDTVDSNISWALANNLENLNLLGSAMVGKGNNLGNVITGNDGANLLYGNGGADTLRGMGGSDTLAGGPGGDTYIVDAQDVLREASTGGIDTVVAETSITLATNFEHLVLSGTGNLEASGNTLANHIEGNAGSNFVSGRGGNDTLRGHDGDDTLEGGLGRDSIGGGDGADVLTGGDGYDLFFFDTVLSAKNVDDITDFKHLADKIVLDAEVFTAFTAGTAITPSQIHQAAGASTAQDADNRLIYDTTTGKLYYDPDGSATEFEAVLFAVLGEDSAPAVSAADFIIGR